MTSAVYQGRKAINQTNKQIMVYAEFSFGLWSSSFAKLKELLHEQRREKTGLRGF